MRTSWRRNASLSIVAIALVFALNPQSPPSSATAAVEATEAVPVATPVFTDYGLRLDVMSYNVFIRPEPVSFGDETACRSARIGDWLAEQPGLDVAVLTETFLRRDVEVLVGNAASRFPHQIVGVPPADNFFGVSGGLSILSRYPIEEWESRKFDVCAGAFSDCLASKGVVWARLRLDDDHKVNIVATHLDAGGGASDVAARKAQLKQVREFMDERVDPRWPTVLTGDFNVDGLDSRPSAEYGVLLEALRGAMGTRRIIDSVDAVSERVEEFAREALDSLNCHMTVWCDGEDRLEEDRRRLDYVFAYDSNDLLARVVEAGHDPVEDDTCGSKFLSDHKAVRAILEFGG